MVMLGREELRLWARSTGLLEVGCAGLNPKV